MSTKSLLPLFIALAVSSLVITPSMAEDWGTYRIVSVSTPEFVLEAVGGVKEGAVVSIQKLSDAANQKWIVIPADGSVRVAPAQDLSLVLSVEKGGNKNGTLIVLEKDRGEASQRWAMKKHDNGSYSLIANHAPEQGLDHNAGKREAGARIDLWTYSAGDTHLQWFIRPLVGSGIVDAKADDSQKYEPPAIKPEDILPGPTQIILPVPDRSRVTGVAIGGPEQDTLFALCMNKIWKRKIQQHAIGAVSPWTKVAPNKL